MKHEVEVLFHELSGLPVAERESYWLERQVPADVRTEVEALLHFDSESADSLTTCVASAAERSWAAHDSIETKTRCGPFRLLRVLGRGGMGSVYFAERADGEVEQRVAIKVIGKWRLEPAFVDRFLRERQILATLNHPGIARLLDVGHTSDGQPYLAMEYVDGVPIDDYAATLDLRRKLTLFLQACEAVAYAHRNLIIHRDLKPSNILVNSSGELKLLDFGIAKILDATIDQALTQERALTPAFASPEQVRGAAQATTTDVYSLGAVLYKLLTGQSPHVLSTHSQQDLELAICLTEPAAPSRLNPSLPKDLDAIILKALRNEPEDRYGSADALAGDIRAFLESRPVAARRGSAWYRGRKFLRRYWAPMAACVAIICSLSAGLLVANRERAIAQRHFLEVRQLANKLFDIDALARQLPGSSKTRQLIVDTSLEYLGRLAADARGDPGLALEIGNAYMWVAQVQGVPISSNLGQIDQAGKNLRLADGFIHSVLVSQPGNRKALLLSAEIARDRMILADIDGRSEESNEFAHQSAASLEKFNAQKSDQSEAPAILVTYLNVAQIYEHAQRQMTRWHFVDAAVSSLRHSAVRRTAARFCKSLRTYLEAVAILTRLCDRFKNRLAALDPGTQSGDWTIACTMNYVMSLVTRGTDPGRRQCHQSGPFSGTQAGRKGARKLFKYRRRSCSSGSQRREHQRQTGDGRIPAGEYSAPLGSLVGAGGLRSYAAPSGRNQEQSEYSVLPGARAGRLQLSALGSAPSSGGPPKAGRSFQTPARTQDVSRGRDWFGYRRASRVGCAGGFRGCHRQPGARAADLPGIAGSDRRVEAGTGKQSGRCCRSSGHLYGNGRGGSASGAFRLGVGSGCPPCGALAPLGAKAPAQLVCTGSDCFALTLIGTCQASASFDQWFNTSNYVVAASNQAAGLATGAPGKHAYRPAFQPASLAPGLAICADEQRVRGRREKGDQRGMDYAHGRPWQTIESCRFG